ncbi:uncharacterized protein LOC125371954 isoform X3 [Haliotis rufescens]|uniref:uncharacterized protein LOC125371954 isoform X3 n=1 Tax=Haliotis rufescens TaxID=6454 RepID=UPI00201F8A79|nr:uncharacterized protein LOC125371954 isoform X3 [Haliotis rufescens]
MKTLSTLVVLVVVLAAATSASRKCKYNRQDKWSECENGKQTATKIIKEGSDKTCPQKKVKTRICACKYQKGNWSECDPATKKMTRTLTLTQGSDQCPPNKTRLRRCRKGKSRKKGSTRRTKRRRSRHVNHKARGPSTMATLRGPTIHPKLQSSLFSSSLSPSNAADSSEHNLRTMPRDKTVRKHKLPKDKQNKKRDKKLRKRKHLTDQSIDQPAQFLDPSFQSTVSVEPVLLPSHRPSTHTTDKTILSASSIHPKPKHSRTQHTRQYTHAKDSPFINAMSTTISPKQVISGRFSKTPTHTLPDRRGINKQRKIPSKQPAVSTVSSETFYDTTMGQSNGIMNYLTSLFKRANKVSTEAPVATSTSGSSSWWHWR